MPASKIGKIKNQRIVMGANGKLSLVNRSDCGAKNVIDYIEDKNNLIKFENLSKEEQKKIIEQYKSKVNFENEDIESINNLINYVSNQNKCFNEDTNSLLISSLNCSNKYNAANEFIECEKEYHKHKIENVGSHIIKDANGNNIRVQNIPNEAFHIIQSFKGQDVPKEKVHEIGVELARRLCGEDYKAVITTHLNTDNYHNHLAICAYNIDGYHKYRDTWNIGLKLQKLSDELSLENGIEIITDIANDKLEIDENKYNNLFDKDIISNDPHFTNISEMKMYKSNTLSKKKLMTDIMLTAKESKSFEEYEKKMKAKGYELVYQEKSIKYIDTTIKKYAEQTIEQVSKNEHSVKKYAEQTEKSLKNQRKKLINQLRDTRLGKQYTRDALEHYFLQKQKNEILDNYENYEKLKINLYMIKPKKFLGTKGNLIRLPLIFQILNFILKLLDALLFANDDYYKSIPDKNPIIEKANKELLQQINKTKKAIEKAKDLMDKYNIQNLNSLKIKKKQILRLYCQHKNQIINKSIAFSQFNKIEKAINKVKELEPYIIEENLTDNKLLIEKAGEGTIKENLAKIDPMQPKTKSRLYKALFNSGYKLKYKFSELTEKDAKEICYFITEKNKGNNIKKPDTLYTRLEYYKLKNSNLLPEIKYTSAAERLHQPDLSIYNDDDIKKIKEYKKNKLLLYSFGLTNEEKIESFISEMNDIKNTYIQIDQTMQEEKNELQNLNFIEEFLNGKINNKFKPLDLFDNIDVINDEINKYINDNESIKEQLITLKTLLSDPYILPNINALDDNNIIIAPAEVLAICKTILSCEGKDLEDTDLLKLSKKELKDIITDFTENYDIDKYLKQELNTEMQIEKQYIINEIKKQENIEALKELVEASKKQINKIEKEKYEEEINNNKNQEELIKQTDKEQEQAINNIINTFIR